jgi:tRNA/rRNA methyltransferase
MHVLVTGATGKVGRRFVDRLLAADSGRAAVSVRALCHNRSFSAGDPRVSIMHGSISDRATVAQALAGVTQAYAMTGYAREFGPPLVDVRAACAQSSAHLRSEAGSPEVAFVFGTERSGLTNDEVAHCHASCAIPADPLHGSLNLAQAVQVAAYEMRLALSAAPPASRFASEFPASVEALEGMYAHLEQALIALGYLDPEEPRKLLPRLRRLLARAQPTASEVDILRGICAAIITRKSERIGSKSPARGRG